MRDLTKLLRNKLRSDKYFRKHSRLGYLPVNSDRHEDIDDEDEIDVEAVRGKEGAQRGQR